MADRKRAIEAKIDMRAEVGPIDMALIEPNQGEAYHRSAIADTLPWRMHAADAATRRPHYDALAELSYQYGAIRERRRRIMSAIRAIDREIERIDRDIAKIKAKEAKRG